MLLTPLRSAEPIFVAVARPIFIVFINFETVERIQLDGFSSPSSRKTSPIRNERNY